jgi:glutamate 5-kinase
MLTWRAIPVVNENDPATMDDITFENNDYLAEQVATMIDADRLIFLTNVEGLYTSDPRGDPSASLIDEVPDVRDLLRRLRISSSAGQFGTGGMYSKVDAAGLATSTGIEALICNGLSRSAISAAFAGEHVGTRFPAGAGKHGTFHARRTWLKSQRSRGELLIDAGAAGALRKRGGSLLPVGIVAVRGKFASGDVVDVALDDDLIGRGITNFSANTVRRLKGRRTAELGQRKPGTPEEVIHRDSFVLE